MSEPLPTSSASPAPVDSAINPDRGSMQREHPHRPSPDPATGALRIDPEILLRARGFGLQVSFYCSSFSDANEEYGRARSSTARAYVSSQVSGSVATLQRGDFSAYAFSLVGASGGISTYAAASAPLSGSTLSYDGAAFTEWMLDGSHARYEDQLGSGNPRILRFARLGDASGNVQTSPTARRPRPGSCARSRSPRGGG